MFDDAALPMLSLRVTPWMAPSELAVRRVAEQIGATLTLDSRRATIILGQGD
jgi:hypothetical protein